MEEARIERKCDCLQILSSIGEAGEEGEEGNRPRVDQDDRTGSARTGTKPARDSDTRGTSGFCPSHIHPSAALPLHDAPLLLSMYLPEKPYLPYSQKTLVQTPLEEVS
jgi:hypothetical protein